MSGRASRNKGKRGELEVVHFCKDRGVPARRTGQMQAQMEATEPDVETWPGIYDEVKRRNRIEIVKWSQEAEAAAGDRMPVVWYRPDNEPWRVSLRAEDYLTLMANGRA